MAEPSPMFSPEQNNDWGGTPESSADPQEVNELGGEATDDGTSAFGSTSRTTENGGVKEKSEDHKEEKKEDNSRFECNICLDTAHDAVISMCGHLFWYVVSQ